MPQTNATVSIYRKTRDWKGAIATPVLVGTYDVWHEERWSMPLKGEVDRKEVEKGLIFLFEDVDLTDCYVRISGSDYTIVAADRFVDRLSEFHHIEFLYR